MGEDQSSGPWRRSERVFWTIAGGWILLDVASKSVALHAPAWMLALEAWLAAWWTDVISFPVLRNPGTAFGVRYPEAIERFFTVLLAVTVILYLYAVFQRVRPSGARWASRGLACMTGGAIGNLVDRVRSPEGVVDFIHVDAGMLAPYVFNVADVGVLMGAGLLVVALARREVAVAANVAREREHRSRSLAGRPR